ncbi:hypothetical protein WMF27_10925 [Sorangium sp. So ce281]|uniref:hypothetical protein n=1 Tax=unclassified Sorangium TaxID=2621164 RepID=UPI003F5F27FF
MPATAWIAPAPAPVGPDAPAAPAARRAAVYVAGGLGAAGLVVGGITGALVFGEKGVIAEHCGSKIGVRDPGVCDSAGADAGNSARQRWVSAGVLEARPAGAVLGARGSF